jgi:hypothetical protein
MPFFLTFISFNIQCNHTFFHPSSFAEARLLVSSSLLRSAREAFLGFQAENRTRACQLTSYSKPTLLFFSLVFFKKVSFICKLFPASVVRVMPRFFPGCHRDGMS